MEVHYCELEQQPILGEDEVEEVDEIQESHVSKTNKICIHAFVASTKGEGQSLRTSTRLKEEQLHEPIVEINKDMLVYEDNHEEDQRNEGKHANIMLMKFDDEIKLLENMLREPKSEIIFHSTQEDDVDKRLIESLIDCLKDKDQNRDLIIGA